MNTIQVKIELLKKGLTVQGMAHELSKNGARNQSSTRVMITQMIYGKRFYPSLAKRIEKRFGLTLTRQPTAVNRFTKKAA